MQTFQYHFLIIHEEKKKLISITKILTAEIIVPKLIVVFRLELIACWSFACTKYADWFQTIKSAIKFFRLNGIT